MNPTQLLANFDANYGFGYDAAGRQVNNNEFSLGQGNFARQATMAERQRLENAANLFDGGGVIRALLQERNRQAALRSGVDPSKMLDLQAGGSVTYAPNYSMQK